MAAGLAVGGGDGSTVGCPEPQAWSGKTIRAANKTKTTCLRLKKDRIAEHHP
jgi:hypothetical protein